MSAIRAYYNEHDPYAAQWIRNLIAAGHVSPGDVDERDIRDVHPDDLFGYTRCHFFAGIGVWDYALGLAGWPTDRSVWTGSCPCQPFSIAGRKAGVEDNRHLWPAWFKLIRACRPPAVLGEQVSGPDGLRWLDVVQSDLERDDYACRVADIPAAGVGAPHRRYRLWFMADSGGYGLQGRQPADEADWGRRLADSCAARNGFWSDADWIPFQDGKARPVEPGTFPVAHGAANRVGRLRAYGNALNAEAAAAFIGACLDERPQGTAARSAETSGLGPQGNGPVGEADAPSNPPIPTTPSSTGA